MDAGDAAAALHWAQRGIDQDLGVHWPELREEAARASFALAGGDFADLLEAAAWVLEGGLLVPQPPSLPQWPAAPAGDGVSLPGTARELLERLDWGLVEQAAGYLEVVAVGLEQGRIGRDRMADREEEIYLAHSALRLATGLVLLLDPNADLADGLQEVTARPCESKGASCLLDSLLAQADGRIFDDLHRSLLSAENLLRVRSGEAPRADLPGEVVDTPLLDPGVPAEAYVGAVRAVVGWMDRAAKTATSRLKPGAGAVQEEPEGHDTEGGGDASGFLSWLLEQIVPAAHAQVPLDGSLRRPLVLPLDAGEDAWQPAGLLPPSGWSVGVGEVLWTRGTTGSVRAFLRAQEIVEGAETEGSAEQLRAAAEASRTLRGSRAFVSLVPLRVGWGLAGLRVGFIPVAQGFAGATTGILGSPEGVGLTALGGEFAVVAQPRVLQMRAATVGLGVRTGVRWVQSTHLQVVPDPRSTGTAWLPRADAELRLGIAPAPGGAVHWGGVVSMPIYSSEPAILPQFIIGSWLAGPALGPLHTRALAEGAVDRDHAMAKAGVGVAAPHAAIVVLRAAKGWEGEVRVGSVAFAMQVARGAMGEPLSIYRLGVSRWLTTSGVGTPARTEAPDPSSFPTSNSTR